MRPSNSHNLDDIKLIRFAIAFSVIIYGSLCFLSLLLLVPLLMQRIWSYLLDLIFHALLTFELVVSETKENPEIGSNQPA